MATTARRVVRAPTSYYGGKQYLVPTLLDLLPPHDVYCEVFGGMASLLLSKPRSGLEVYNDLDDGLVNFFRVLRDPRQAKRLQHLLGLTPYARGEYYDCRATWRETADPAEMARRWFVALSMSFSRTPSGQHGWAYTKQPNGHSPQKFRNWIAALPEFTARLALVQIEHLDALDLIRKYDAPNVLFFCDPPYVASTRGTTREYAHEMGDEAHARLLELLRTVQGKVILSGYRSPFYDEALADWRRVDIGTMAWSSNRSGNQQTRAREKRTECIWLSPGATAAQPQLWETARTLIDDEAMSA